MHLSEFW